MLCTGGVALAARVRGTACEAAATAKRERAALASGGAALLAGRVEETTELAPLAA